MRKTQAQRASQPDTRQRLLDAAEWLFIEQGYEAMSLRQVTTKAAANLAAVNYHFGGKEALVQELLSNRLDRLNKERLQLLSASERLGPVRLDATAILGMLFVPAFRLSHGNVSGPAFMRLLGRVYSDPSPFIRGYLQQHYKSISGRFFEAFSQALPELPRHELGLRLHFALKAISGMLAGEDMQVLIASITKGETINDAELIARLTSLISPILTAPFGNPADVDVIAQVLKLDHAAASESARAIRSPIPDVNHSHAVQQWIDEARAASPT